MHGAALIGICIVAFVPLHGWLWRILLLTHPRRGSGTASEAFAEDPRLPTGRGVTVGSRGYARPVLGGTQDRCEWGTDPPASRRRWR